MGPKEVRVGCSHCWHYGGEALVFNPEWTAKTCGALLYEHVREEHPMANWPLAYLTMEVHGEVRTFIVWLPKVLPEDLQIEEVEY